MSRPLLLVDGVALPIAPPCPLAWAAATSRLFPALDVAVCTPGDARGLRRFRAGLPLDPPRSPR